MSENYIQMICEDKIYPIVRCKEAQQAIEVSKALVEGGIRVLEINVENPSIYEAIAEISKIAHVCAGGIITTMQADAAFKSGAQLFSSPIFQMNMVKISKNKRVQFIAGASTANEAYNAWQARMPMIKIYPVAEMGGVEYIREMVKPMPFLNLLPCGFVKISEVEGYLKAGAKAVGIGRELYAKEDSKEIIETAKNVVEMVRQI